MRNRKSLFSWSVRQKPEVVVENDRHEVNPVEDEEQNDVQNHAEPVLLLDAVIDAENNVRDRDDRKNDIDDAVEAVSSLFGSHTFSPLL